MNEYKDKFPFFKNRTTDISYLDSAATSHRPFSVIEREVDFLSNQYATVHRGAYQISAEATQNLEDVRAKVATFLNAAKSEEIIFTQGATGAINTIARGLEREVSEKDTVLVSILEHHSNFVPWQILCEKRGANFETVNITKNGNLDYKDLEEKLNKLQPKVLSVTHVSNLLGTVFDVERIVSLAKKTNTLVVLDAAQSVPHMKVDVQKLGIDFLVFSAHKMYAPTGLGVLYGKSRVLEQLEPLNYGGGMISQVAKEKTSFAELPNRLEAGTPAISQIIAFGEALQFIDSIGIENIENLEKNLFNKLWSTLKNLDFIDIYGPMIDGEPQQAVVSFNMHGVHPHDAATCLDTKGVLLRAGHHCAMPALKELGVPGTLRASIGIYNDEEDIKQLEGALKYARKIFSK